MVSRLIVIVNVLRRSCAEMRLSQEDQPAQTLRFYGPYESFRDGVGFGNAWWAEDDFYPGGLQDLTEALAVLRIPVDDQVGLATSKAIHSVGQLPGHLRHPLAIG
jgi:hypothetical protein